MANRVVERGYYEILADPANISLACEVFSRLSAKRKTGAKSQDAVLSFLQKSENAEVVSTICTQFPSVLIRLVRTVLLPQLVDRCKAKLEDNVEWQVALYEIGEQFDAKELYPGIELSPKAFSSRQHWSFYLELRGAKAAYDVLPRDHFLRKRRRTKENVTRRCQGGKRIQNSAQRTIFGYSLEPFHLLVRKVHYALRATHAWGQTSSHLRNT